MAKMSWTAIMVREFESLVPMSDDQRIVFSDMVAGRSIVHTATTHNMSTRKVDSIRQWIKMMYKEVQIYTPLLPEWK